MQTYPLAGPGTMADQLARAQRQAEADGYLGDSVLVTIRRSGDFCGFGGESLALLVWRA